MTPADLRDWRKRLGLTQMEAAGILNRTRETIVQYERGRQPIPPEIALATVGWERMTASERDAFQARAD